MCRAVIPFHQVEDLLVKVEESSRERREDK
jgi:hypothetical protein